MIFPMPKWYEGGAQSKYLVDSLSNGIYNRAFLKAELLHNSQKQVFKAPRPPLGVSIYDA